MIVDYTGDPRGVGALDIQSARTNVTQVASGQGAVAFGQRNTASGSYSTSIGYSNTVNNTRTVALGYNNTGSGAYSAAMGVTNTASGYVSSASGTYNTASGNYANAHGYNNQATALNTSSFGSGNQATVDYSTAFGYGNIATGSGVYSIGQASAFGYQNQALGSQSTAIGWTNTVSAYTTTGSAVGFQNTVSANYSAAFGQQNTVTGGGASSAFGYQNNVSQSLGSAFGFGNQVTDAFGSAFGAGNTASAYGAVSFGKNNTASGIYSSAFGINNTAGSQAAITVLPFTPIDGDELSISGDETAFINGADSYTLSVIENNGSARTVSSVIFGGTNTTFNISSRINIYSTQFFIRDGISNQATVTIAPGGTACTVTGDITGWLINSNSYGVDSVFPTLTNQPVTLLSVTLPSDTLVQLDSSWLESASGGTLNVAYGFNRTNHTFGRNLTNLIDGSVDVGPSNAAKFTVLSDGKFSVANGTYTVTATDGTAGQALVTNGAGVVTFQTVSGSGGGAVWQVPEVPFGLIDGSNTTYILSYIPVTYSGTLTLNGRVFTETVDFTISGNIITMTIPIEVEHDGEDFYYRGQLASTVDSLLLEDGTSLLLEDGTELLLE